MWGVRVGVWVWVWVRVDGEWVWVRVDGCGCGCGCGCWCECECECLVGVDMSAGGDEVVAVCDMVVAGEGGRSGLKCGSGWRGSLFVDANSHVHPRIYTLTPITQTPSNQHHRRSFFIYVYFSCSNTVVSKESVMTVKPDSVEGGASRRGGRALLVIKL